MNVRQELLSLSARLIDISNHFELRKPTRSQRRTSDERCVRYPTYHRLLQAKYPHGRSGAKRAFLDYNEAEYTAGKTTRRITEGMEQSWLREGAVPVWAYRYLQDIDVLPARPRKTHWTIEEVRYLANLIRRYPAENYPQLAERCSRRFRRPVSVCAIKGTTSRHRIGKQSRIA